MRRPSFCAALGDARRASNRIPGGRWCRAAPTGTRSSELVQRSELQVAVRLGPKSWRAGSPRNILERVGTIFYGGTATPIRIEDRALAHLKVVIATKLRRSESFTLSWRHPDDEPAGRSTIWLHPSIPLRFVFDDPEPAELSRQWIEDLAHSANSSGGIMLVAEYFEPNPPRSADLNEPAVAVGAAHVEELAIDKLTVAGIELGDVAPPDRAALQPSESQVSV